jgi:trk system potassium uptake protein TrkA
MKRVAVIGLGQFGASVASRLYAEGVEVLAVDLNLRLVDEIKDQVSVAVAFDATIKENLLAYDVDKMDAVIIAIGSNFDAAVLVCVLCREMQVPLIIVKALSHLQAKVHTAIGAHRVVMPEEEMGFRLAEHLVHESVVDFVELPAGYCLRRIAVPAAWVGKSLAELALLRSERLNLIQIVRPPSRVGAAVATTEGTGGGEPERIALPHGGTRLQAGDRIDVIGAEEVLRRHF